MADASILVHLTIRLALRTITFRPLTMQYRTEVVVRPVVDKSIQTDTLSSHRQLSVCGGYTTCALLSHGDIVIGATDAANWAFFADYLVQVHPLRTATDEALRDFNQIAYAHTLKSFFVKASIHMFIAGSTSCLSTEFTRYVATACMLRGIFFETGFTRTTLFRDVFSVHSHPTSRTIACLSNSVTI